MLLVDTADKALILEGLKFPSVTGFTTNPTLVTRAAGVDAISLSDYIARALDLCTLPKTARIETLMIQGVGTQQQILEQAVMYVDALKSSPDTKLWIKLPPTQSGIGCIPALQKMGCSTLVTAVYTAAQANVAIKAGADSIAVYLGRLIRLEKEWEAQLERITHVMYEAQKMLLLASFPDLETVERGLDYSRDLTVPPAVLNTLLDSPHTTDALKAFDSKVLMA